MYDNESVSTVFCDSRTTDRSEDIFYRIISAATLKNMDFRTIRSCADSAIRKSASFFSTGR